MVALFACTSGAKNPDTLVEALHEMVTRQIERRGVQDKSVLQAMRNVPRHEFVPEEMRSFAYDDSPLPIGYDQTISQPYIVAYMSQALQVSKGDKVLEVGTGSGYQAAVLAEMGAEVYSIEIVKPLGERAKATLDRLGYNVKVKIGDGYQGWPSQAPFKGIIVTAAPEQIPPPLVEQLQEGGTLVIPVGRNIQDLQIYAKHDNALKLVDTLPVRFVPMTGKAQGPSL